MADKAEAGGFDAGAFVRGTRALERAGLPIDVRAAGKLYYDADRSGACAENFSAPGAVPLLHFGGA